MYGFAEDDEEDWPCGAIAVPGEGEDAAPVPELAHEASVSELARDSQAGGEGQEDAAKCRVVAQRQFDHFGCFWSAAGVGCRCE